LYFRKKNEKFFNDCGSDRKWLNLKGKKKSGVSGKILIGIDISQNRPSKVDVKVKKRKKENLNLTQARNLYRDINLLNLYSLVLLFAPFVTNTFGDYPKSAIIVMNVN